MNLEELEQQSLRYLMRVASPLVRADVLLEHLRLEEGLATLERGRLLDFLRNHELFRVVEPGVSFEDPAMAALLKEAGFPVETCVILETRIPTPKQTAELMQQQLANMYSALSRALEEARIQGDESKESAISRVLERVERLASGLGGSTPASPSTE